jgi:Raf kinase inhibitor-like YbhB/YbcL family protein
MQRSVFVSLLALPLFIACSSSSTPSISAADGGGADTGTTPAVDAGATVDAGPEETGPFTLESKELEEGATFDKDLTCNGKNQGPSFQWKGAPPEGTQSFALVMVDRTLKNFYHWAIVDIAKDVRELPAAIPLGFELETPAGAKQIKNYQGKAVYAGPCPPNGEDTYEFALYALGVPSLDGVTDKTTGAAIVKLVQENSLGVAKLTGKYQQPAK